ncbi:uncharacterized protein [Nicotiana sylvestris]|uniref:uncharacterized protein n=1 Tax=Nicotiana sylvestris TaxID=4096 RepID=UPI00388C91AF
MARKYCGWSDGITLQMLFLDEGIANSTNGFLSLQKKAETSEYLKGNVNRIRVSCEELRAQVQARALEEMSASAKVPAVEVQLSLTHNNAKVQTDMIGKLESSLSKVRAEIIDARLRSELLCQGSKLQKILDEGESFRLLSKEKEVELQHWLYEAYLSSNYESYLMEQANSLLPYQLQKKAEALEFLKGDVNRVRVSCEELRAQVQAQALEEMSASAKVPAFEVQLSLTHDNTKVKADMLEKLESDLSKVRAEIIDDWAEAALSRTRADREMEISTKDVADAQAEQKRALDQEKRIEEYVCCISRIEVLEEVGAKGFVLSEELARARADESDAWSLLIDALFVALSLVPFFCCRF